MDRKNAQKVLSQEKGTAIKNDDGNTVAHFTRATEKTIEEIENLTDEHLMNKIRKLDTNIHDVGVYSVCDIQKAQLCMLELEERDLLKKYKEEKKEQKQRQDLGKEKYNNTSDEELLEEALERGVMTDDADDSKETRLCEAEILRRGLIRKLWSRGE